MNTKLKKGMKVIVAAYGDEWPGILLKQDGINTWFVKDDQGQVAKVAEYFIYPVKKT